LNRERLVLVEPRGADLVMSTPLEVGRVEAFGEPVENLWIVFKKLWIITGFEM
jgi:hypothetical protein